MFGEHLCVNCTNQLCVSGHDPFTDTKFTRPITKMSKSSSGGGAAVNQRGSVKARRVGGVGGGERGAASPINESKRPI